MKFHRLLVIGLLALFAAGCASNDIPDPDADAGGSFEAEDNSAETDGFGEDGMGDGEEFGDDFSAEEEMTMIGRDSEPKSIIPRSSSKPLERRFHLHNLVQRQLAVDMHVLYYWHMTHHGLFRQMPKVGFAY